MERLQAWDERGKPLKAFLLSKTEFESIMQLKQVKPPPDFKSGNDFVDAFLAGFIGEMASRVPR